MPHNVPLSPTVRFSGVVEHWVFTQQTHTKGGTTASLQLQQETCAALTRHKKKKTTQTHTVLVCFKKRKKKGVYKICMSPGFYLSQCRGESKMAVEFSRRPMLSLLLLSLRLSIFNLNCSCNWLEGQQGGTSLVGCALPH